MARKIIVNLFAAFIILPILIEVRSLYSHDINSLYEQYNSLDNWIKQNLLLLISLSTFFLVFILFPFQLIKDYIHSINKRISFFYKLLLFIGLVTIFFILVGTFFIGLWLSPWWLNYEYLIGALFLGIIFTPFLYFMIDKHVENESKGNILYNATYLKYLLYIFIFIIIIIVILFHSK